MDIKEIIPIWLKDGLKREVMAKDAVLKMYESLTDKTTDYAKSIKKILDVRIQIVKIWEDNQ